MIKNHDTFFLDLLKLVYYYINQLFILFELYTCNTGLQQNSIVVYKNSELYNCIRDYRFIYKDFYSMKYSICPKEEKLHDIEAGMFDPEIKSDIFIKLENEGENLYITTTTETPFGEQFIKLIRG